MRNPLVYILRLDKWFSTWGSFGIFLGSRELINIFIVTSRFYISYMEPLFVVAKIIESPDKSESYFFIQNCDYDHYSTVAFASAQITL